MEQLFIGCLVAQQPQERGQKTRISGYLNLHEGDLEQAKEIALAACHRTFPESQGFYNHQADVEAVTSTTVDMLTLWCVKRLLQIQSEGGTR